MPSNTLEKYQKLLAKEPQIGETYVIIDQKWFDHWKRYVGIEKTDENRTTDPGPIDFTGLACHAISERSDEIQLRSDAVEGNDYTFIPYELYEYLEEAHSRKGSPITRRVIRHGEYQTIIEALLVPLRLRESRQRSARTKQIYRRHKKLLYTEK